MTGSTHKQRVLSLLKDGAWHSHHEGYRLGVMLHSRVADLRGDGHIIECRRNGELYEYRLTLEEATGHFPTVASPSAPAGHDSAVNTPHVAEPVSDVAAAGALPSPNDQLVMTDREFRRTL